MRAMITARYGGRLAAIAASAALTAAIFVLPAKADTDPQAVITTYADIALAKYEDSLTTAKLLDQAVDALHRQAVGRHAECGARGMEGGASALPADRGLPLRQCDRRRLGRHA